MTETTSATDAISNETALRKDALGLLGTVSLTAAYMAPAASLVALFGVMVASAGVSTGFVMLLGLLITLPSAVSFGMLARQIPSAGGAATWARHALGELVGRWMGLTTAIYYLVTVVVPPIVFGQLFVELVSMMLGDLPQTSQTLLWIVGVVLSFAIAGYSAYRGVTVSSWLAFAMLLLQLLIMSALTIHFLFHADTLGTLSWKPFLPPGSGESWSGILLALPLAMLSLVCDGATPASEETRDARRTIPLAIFLTLLLVGLWDVVAFGAFAMAAPRAELIALSSDPLKNPVPLLAGRVWGTGKILVTLTGMLAMIGALVPCSTAASRLLMSLGRDGTLPRWLGYVHPRFRTPWHGLHVVYLLGFLAVVPPALVFGPNPTIGWWGIIVVWFILAVYFVTNLSNIVYHRRHLRKQFNPLLNLAIPTIAMLIQVFVLWQVVIVEPWNAGWIGRSAQLFIVLGTAISAIYVSSLRRDRGTATVHSELYDTARLDTEPVGEVSSEPK